MRRIACGRSTWAKDVIRLHEPGAEMIGVGPFIPHSNTPLHGATGGTVERTLRLVAVLRLAFPDAHIPATTAMGILHPLGRERALRAGANVMMPNVTPTAQRAKYEIYPDKICLSDDRPLPRLHQPAHPRPWTDHRDGSRARETGGRKRVKSVIFRKRG